MESHPEALRTEPRTCDEHGQYLASEMCRGLWTHCPRCAAVREEAERARQQSLDAARQKAKMQALLQQSGLRGRYLQASFDSFSTGLPKQAEVLQTCRSYVEDLRAGEWAPLWLVGPPGVGKTHLASAMVLGMIERGMQAEIATARSIIARLRGTWRRDTRETEQDVCDDLAASALLVIDEIGVGFNTDAEITQLFDVVDARYQLQRSVVISSNLTAKDLRAVIGDRLFDRLRENARLVPCAWPSHRNWARRPGRGEGDEGPATHHVDL